MKKIKEGSRYFALILDPLSGVLALPLHLANAGCRVQTVVMVLFIFCLSLGPWATYVDESKVAKPSEVSSLKN